MPPGGSEQELLALRQVQVTHKFTHTQMRV